jgi:recombination associated protein RdgC
MFKHATLYTLQADWSVINQAHLEERLGNAQFQPCGKTQAKSLGFAPPRGDEFNPLVEKVGHHYILMFSVATRSAPGQALKERVDELAEQVERNTGRKPGKKGLRELREQATLDLMPRAFPKRANLMMWIDTKKSRLVVASSTIAKADEAASSLVKALEGQISVQQLHTQSSVIECMAHWLAESEPPRDFSLDRECELKSQDQMKSVVRYDRHNLELDEVREHILTRGKTPTKLAMTWNSRVSFVINDRLQVTKIKLLDVVMEGQRKDNAQEAFDADCSIATAELSGLIGDLVFALGGLKTQEAA